MKAFEGQQILTAAGIVQGESNDWIHPGSRAPRYEQPVQDLLTKLESMLRAYNFDGSDISSDYFHVRFYSHVNVGWELERDSRAAVKATITPEMKAAFLNV